MTDFEKLKQTLAIQYPYTTASELQTMATNLIEAFNIAAEILIEQSDIVNNLDTLTDTSPDVEELTF